MSDDDLSADDAATLRVMLRYAMEPALPSLLALDPTALTGDVLCAMVEPLIWKSWESEIWAARERARIGIAGESEAEVVAKCERCVGAMRTRTGLSVLIELWREQLATASQTAPPATEGPGAIHSIDFRSVKWFGTEYTFSPNQAACVKVWWEHWKQGTPDVGDATILETAGIHSERIDSVFRNCKAWGTMIVPGKTKGTHRLQPRAGAK